MESLNSLDLTEMSLDSDFRMSSYPDEPNNRFQYRIFLGIEHQQNRQLLMGLLGQFYSLQDRLEGELDWGQAFDLCIFDSWFFGKYKDQIAAQRTAAIPVFLPFLLLLKRSHLSLLSATQRQQVDDVIMLPVDQIELMMRVESLLRARQQSLKLRALLAQEQLLEQQLQVDNQILHTLAVQDGLTGIPNRRAFDEKLVYEWRLGRREQSLLTVVICDVDHFKIFNDTYGHLVGDECLKTIAEMLDTEVKRPADMVARFGGEEFALILPNTELEGALYLLEGIRSTLRSRAINHTNSPTGPYVSLSFGLAQVVPCKNIETIDLLRAADSALYQAKTKGRDQIAVAPPLECETL